MSGDADAAPAAEAAPPAIDGLKHQLKQQIPLAVAALGSGSGDAPWLLLSRRRVALTCVAVLVVLTAALGLAAVRSGSHATVGGHRFHPRICEAGEDGAAAAASCERLLDPAAEALGAVTLPPGGLRLASQDSQLASLARQLESAVAAHWPLAIARRQATVALEHMARDGTFAMPDVGASSSGHAPGWRFLLSALTLLSSRGEGGFVPCAHEPTIPTLFGTRYLFAATLGGPQAAKPLPNALLQLLRTLVFIPPGFAAVSVHESGASDDARAWLDLLQLLAAPLGVPVVLATGGQPYDPQAESRVEFIAAARNMALTPFFGRPESPLSREGCPEPSPPPAGAPAPVGGAAAHNPACFAPQYVVIFDATYFCFDDVLRLMEYPADLACGVKFAEPAQRRRAAQRLQRRRLLQAGGGGGNDSSNEGSSGWERGGEEGSNGGEGSGGEPALAGGRRRGPLSLSSAAAPTAPTVVLLPDVAPKYYMKGLEPEYDAFRDLSGAMLSKQPPYLQDPSTQSVALAGGPFPAHCCWGGLAKVAATAFEAGLRFRPPVEGECQTAEGSLLCDDLHRLGMRQVLVDPSVRTSDQLRTKTMFATDNFPFFYYTVGLWGGRLACGG